jgi:hypothetical protein
MKITVGAKIKKEMGGERKSCELSYECKVDLLV